MVGKGLFTMSQLQIIHRELLLSARRRSHRPSTGLLCLNHGHCGSGDAWIDWSGAGLRRSDSGDSGEGIVSRMD